MCFAINRKAKAPAQKRAWKVVAIRGEEVRSLNRNQLYFPGEFTLPMGFEPEGWDSAKEGYYVYLDKKRAKMLTGGNVVLLEVIVDPKDWLVSSGVGRMATYRKIKIPVAQPEIEWYA